MYHNHYICTTCKNYYHLPSSTEDHSVVTISWHKWNKSIVWRQTETKKRNQYINHTQHLMLLLLQCSDNSVTSIDLKYLCIRIREKQKWNWRLANNKCNKRTAVTLIVNMQSGNWMEPNLFCCCNCCFFLWSGCYNGLFWGGKVPLII